MNSNAIAQREFSGLRLYGGIRSLDDELMALELGGFWLVDRKNAGGAHLDLPIAKQASSPIITRGFKHQ